MITQGKWEVGKDGYTVLPASGSCLYVAQTHPHDPDHESNAALIAAAPELLEACKSSHAAMIAMPRPNPFLGTSLIIELQNIIAKAERSE